MTEFVPGTCAQCKATGLPILLVRSGGTNAIIQALPSRASGSERLAGQVLTAAAKRLLFMRAALIFASFEVSIFVIAVSLTIWAFEGNALEKWCMRCAFGVDRKLLPDAYQDADSQLKAYGEAIQGVQ